MKPDLHSSSHPNKRLTRSSHGRQLILGAEIVGLLIPARHPMIMVDRVIDYRSSPHPQLVAERYVSANEPAFVGHFPDLKMWPGVLTIEGLKQCCDLLDTLSRLEADGLLVSLFALQKGYSLRQPVDETPRQHIFDVLEEIRRPEPSSLMLRVKLLAPIFAGCVIEYRVRHRGIDTYDWSVQAMVEGSIVAKGEISWRPIAG